MTDKEAWDYGAEMARQTKDHIYQELEELSEPMTQEQKYMFWQAFHQEIEP